jgi:histidinol-phosphate aminotransferase
VSRFRRPSLGDDFGYTPGEQPPDAGGWLKLNTNEAPMAPSPFVAEAVAGAAADLHRYPNPFAEPLRSELARYHGLSAEQVFVGNGADQVLDCCFRAYVEPGAAVVHTSPTYSLIPVLAALFTAREVAIPLARDGGLGTDFAAQPAALRFVVNPNTPTGAWTAPKALSQLLDGAGGVVVIDEAYCDFAPASCVSLLAAHQQWLVVRTLSKSHALAGLRVGYALGSAELIADLYAVKDSYPVDRCAIAGAIAALRDELHHRAIVDTVLRERARMNRALKSLGWDVAHSEANFVFARPPAGTRAEDVAATLRANRILVRHFDAAALRDHLRISVADAAGVDRLLAAMTPPRD